eukprot:SAG25_NODE_75_length_16951_cov_86.523208_15_plen_47_part_00
MLLVLGAWAALRKAMAWLPAEVDKLQAGYSSQAKTNVDAKQIWANF